MSRKPTPILIPMKDVSALTSLSRTMVNRLRVAGRFPDAIELGERRVAFLRSEVLAWIEERIAGRGSKGRETVGFDAQRGPERVNPTNENT